MMAIAAAAQLRKKPNPHSRHLNDFMLSALRRLLPQAGQNVNRFWLGLVWGMANSYQQVKWKQALTALSGVWAIVVLNRDTAASVAWGFSSIPMDKSSFASPGAIFILSLTPVPAMSRSGRDGRIDFKSAISSTCPSFLRQFGRMRLSGRIIRSLVYLSAPITI